MLPAFFAEAHGFEISVIGIFIFLSKLIDITTDPIVGWLNDKMSDDDDGKLTRFTTMDGRYMYIIVEQLIKYGFRPPELINDTIHFHDFYLKVYEYQDYSKFDFSKYKSLFDSLSKNKINIIAEIKKASPSKGVILEDFQPLKIAIDYETGGASAISVLTDENFFQGKIDYLTAIKSVVTIPLLRKDFVIDEYQIIEAKANGADVILLIAAILSRNEIKNFSSLANNLGLEVLLEVHNLEEIQKSIMPTIDLFGVNNRNLKTFEVSLETSRSLAEKIPDQFLKVSESGISDPNSIEELIEFGYKGFLIGENFMRSDHPGNTAKDFIKKITQ